MKIYPIIPAICLMTIFCTKGVCQTCIDERNLYEWQLQRPDTAAILYNMKAYNITIEDAAGTQTLAFEKQFDKAHYLTRMAVYDEDQPWSNPQVNVERWGPDSMKVSNRLSKKALPVFADTGLEHLIATTAQRSDSAFFTVVSIYKRYLGVGFNVTTIVDGQDLGKVHFRSLFDSLPPPPVIVVQKDTTFLGDTIVIRSVDRSDLPYIESKSFFYLKGISDPVRVDTRDYQGDSLIQYSWETRLFDAQRRMIAHVICGRDGEVYKLRERIVYDAKTQEKTVFDNIALEPDQHWTNIVYHYKGDLCTQVDYLGFEEKGMAKQYFYTYYANGQYRDITKLTNGKFEFKRVYHYAYYQ